MASLLVALNYEQVPFIASCAPCPGLIAPPCAPFMCWALASPPSLLALPLERTTPAAHVVCIVCRVEEAKEPALRAYNILMMHEGEDSPATAIAGVRYAILLLGKCSSCSALGACCACWDPHAAAPDSPEALSASKHLYTRLRPCME